jgi:hypothetical protein
MKKFSLTSSEFFAEEYRFTTLKGNARTHLPVFIKLHQKEYENWIIHIDDLDMSNSHGITFSYRVATVPKYVQEEFIFSCQEDIKKFLSENITDILDAFIKENQ